MISGLIQCLAARTGGAGPDGRPAEPMTHAMAPLAWETDFVDWETKALTWETGFLSWERDRISWETESVESKTEADAWETDRISWEMESVLWEMELIFRKTEPVARGTVRGRPVPFGGGGSFPRRSETLRWRFRCARGEGGQSQGGVVDTRAAACLRQSAVSESLSCEGNVCAVVFRNRRALAVTVMTVIALALVVSLIALWSATEIGPPLDCSVHVPPIVLRTVGTSEEMAFFVEDSTFHPEPRVSNLSYELAQYPADSDFLGPGQVVRSGPLSSLNTSGDLQYHDMPAEGEFSPWNDFFILKNPPPMTVQLRILDASGEAIAWNMIVGCI